MQQLCFPQCSYTLMEGAMSTLKGAVVQKSKTFFCAESVFVMAGFDWKIFLNLVKDFNTVKRARLFKASPVMSVIFLVGQSIDVTNGGTFTPTLHWYIVLGVLLKNPRTANPVTLPTVHASSSLLLPLKVVVPPEMLTRKALGVLLFCICMSLRTAAPSLKLGNLCM